MTDLSTLLDAYNRQARLYPALLTILPCLLLGFAVFPPVFTGNIGPLLLSLLASCGLIFLLAEASRTFGKRKEVELLNEWGGWPTTLWLRHSTEYLPIATKARYHSFLTRSVPDLIMPSSDEEKNDPTRADGQYDSAVHWLKEQCRGKQFSLVLKENTAYGFRRNLLGLRPVGIFVSLFALAVPVVLIAAKFVQPLRGSECLEVVLRNPQLAAAAVLAFISIWIWVFAVSSRWVRQAADGYARALLAACDSPPAMKGAQ